MIRYAKEKHMSSFEQGDWTRQQKGNIPSRHEHSASLNIGGVYEKEPAIARDYVGLDNMESLQKRERGVRSTKINSGEGNTKI